MFDATALIQSKERYENEVINLRNIVLEKFKDIDFLKEFDWKLCVVSGTVRAKIPDDWKYFMKLIEVKGYPSPILGLEAPYEMIRIRFNGREIFLRTPAHNREIQFGFANFLNADLGSAKSFFRGHIKGMTRDLKRNDLACSTRVELREEIKEYEDSLEELSLV